MSTKKLLLRADGNSEIGLGHLYRMFALYEMYKSTNECFILTSNSSSLNIIPDDYRVEILPFEVSLNAEAQWIKNMFGDNYIIIADGYQFDSMYQKRIKEQGFKLIFIDDLENQHMYADIVINHSPSAKAENYKTEKYTKLALGTKYAILRPLFLEAAKKSNKIIIHVLDIAFVCFGGVDKNDLTVKVVKALLQIQQIKKINVVLGGSNTNKNIYRLEKCTSKVHIYKNLSEYQLLSVMQESNIAIVPSSTVLFELLTIKMPILTGYCADNQKRFYYYLHKNNIVRGIGNFNKASSSSIKNKLLSILEEEIHPMMENQNMMINGEQKKKHNDLIETLRV